MENHYIRLISEASLEDTQNIFDSEGDSGEEDDENEIQAAGTKFRMVVCMTPGSSRRLLQAQYLQSDISFKRINGFEEFELGGLDANSRTSECILSAFLNEL